MDLHAVYRFSVIEYNFLDVRYMNKIWFKYVCKIVSHFSILTPNTRFVEVGHTRYSTSLKNVDDLETWKISEQS